MGEQVAAGIKKESSTGVPQTGGTLRRMPQGNLRQISQDSLRQISQGRGMSPNLITSDRYLVIPWYRKIPWRRLTQNVEGHDDIRSAGRIEH